MKAGDVMVRNVITVGPDASVQEVATILLQNCVSAVPVVAQTGKLLGIVSEGCSRLGAIRSLTRPTNITDR
jgi:CBS domain-containing protein